MEKIISEEHYQGAIFDHQDLRAIDASECTFSHCSFVGSDLTDAKCNAARFEDCTLEGAKLSGVNLFDVVFSGCKLIGVDFSNKTKILATQFKNCILDFANFTGVDLSSLEFDHCSCIEANFAKSVLKKTVFFNSSLRNSIFTGAHFEQTDLHTSTLSGFDIYENKIRGIILSPQQFLALASEIGVSIVE